MVKIYNRLLILLLFLVLFSYSVNPAISDSKYKILLQSREFIPNAGLSTSVQNYINENSNLGKIHLLMQFDHILSDSEKLNLENKGIKVLDYIPNYAYLVSVNKESINEISSVNYVRAVDILSISDKIHPKVLEYGVGPWAKTKDNRAVIVVLFYKDVSLSEAKNIVTNFNANIIGEIKTVNGLQIAIDESKIKDLASNDKVLWIEESLPKPEIQNDYSRIAVDVDFDSSNSQGLHGSPFTLNNDYGLTGQGIKIMLREFSNPGPHPDYNSRVQIIENFPVGIDDHITHISGILIGNGSKSIEKGGTKAYQWRGMAPEANIIYYIVTGGPGGDPTKEDFYFDYQDTENDHLDAVSRGAKIASHSYGIPVFSNSTSEEHFPGTCHFYGEYSTLGSILDDVVHNNFISIAKSAGNDRVTRNLFNTCGPDDYNTTTPFVDAKNIIAVGAIYSQDNSIVIYSAFGPTDDGRIKPELVAPGEGLRYDICPTGPNDCRIYSTWVNVTNPTEYGYVMKGGTSMAAPVVAGSGGLLLEQLNNQGIIVNLASTLKAILIHTSKDLDRTGNGVVSNDGPDYANGYGLIDVRKAVDLIKETNSTYKSFVEKSIINGQEKNYTILVKNSNPLKVSLAWDDYQGIPLASKALVNDVDVKLISPSNLEYYPYILDPSNPSNPATNGIDNINNIEQILVNNPEVGVWTLNVKGNIVPQGPQKVSLVAPNPFICGDVSNDDSVTLSDVISLVNYIFNKPGGPWIKNFEAADVNGDGLRTLSDVISLVNYVFNKPGGPWLKCGQNLGVLYSKGTISVSLNKALRNSDGTYTIPVYASFTDNIQGIKIEFNKIPINIDKTSLSNSLSLINNENIIGLIGVSNSYMKPSSGIILSLKVKDPNLKIKNIDAVNNNGQKLNTKVISSNIVV